jgi:lipopolysaccharide exporter
VQEQAETRDKSLGRHMLHGSFWMIAMRWAMRFIGVISTIILARLLSPSDFGIIAMAMIVVGMLEILNQTGQKLVIIRHSCPSREDYDTCWSISVLIGLGIALAIMGLAPISRHYFHDIRAVPVMQCLALRSAIGGFENVGVLDFRRKLEFDRLFRYNLYPKLFSFIITIALAFELRNYWALAGGMISNVAITTVLSFTMHSYRPRFSFARVREMWSFSLWTLVRTIGWWMNFQVDQFAIGGVAGAAAMGRYAVATDVAAIPTQELNDPMVVVLYPVMAKVQNDLPKLKELYLRVLCWSAIICASTSVGVTLVAHDMVPVFLGTKWVSVEPLVGWLALSVGMLGLASGAYSTFDALGRPSIGARMQWVRLVLLCIAIAPVAVLTRNIELIAITRFAVTLLFMPTLFFAVGRATGVSSGDYVRAFWRPFAATFLMAVVVAAMNTVLFLSPVLRLGLDVAVGAVVFAGSLFFLWYVSGCPTSPESDVLSLLRARGFLPGKTIEAQQSW